MLKRLRGWLFQPIVDPNVIEPLYDARLDRWEREWVIQKDIHVLELADILRRLDLPEGDEAEDEEDTSANFYFDIGGEG